MPTMYDDLAPVQLINGQFFDRHNDRLALFDQSVEDAVRQRIVCAVNTHAALVDSLKEMRDACAAAMRVLAKAGLAASFGDELVVAGVKDGFGKRADAALALAEEPHDD